MQQTQILTALVTAGATILAAIVTGFGAAALKNKWDRESREADWTRETHNRRRAEVIRACEDELKVLMTLEQQLWHPCNRDEQVRDLPIELADSIRVNMRLHGSAFAVLELVGSDDVVRLMEEVNAALVATFMTVSRDNLESMKQARLKLTKQMRGDVELPALRDEYVGGGAILKPASPT